MISKLRDWLQMRYPDLYSDELTDEQITEVIIRILNVPPKPVNINVPNEVEMIAMEPEDLTAILNAAVNIISNGNHAIVTGMGIRKEPAPQPKLVLPNAPQGPAYVSKPILFVEWFKKDVVN